LEYNLSLWLPPMKDTPARLQMNATWRWYHRGIIALDIYTSLHRERTIGEPKFIYSHAMFDKW
jgi:hypothetical protein